MLLVAHGAVDTMLTLSVACTDSIVREAFAVWRLENPPRLNEFPLPWGFPRFLADERRTGFILQDGGYTVGDTGSPFRRRVRDSELRLELEYLDWTSGRTTAGELWQHRLRRYTLSKLGVSDVQDTFLNRIYEDCLIRTTVRAQLVRTERSSDLPVWWRTRSPWPQAAIALLLAGGAGMFGFFGYVGRWLRHGRGEG